MNYLQLVQRVRLESGIGTGSTISSLGGPLDRDAQRMKGWVDDAWRDLQMLPHNWRWMKRDVAFEVPADGWRFLPTDISPAMEWARADRTRRKRATCSRIPDDWSITVTSPGMSIADMPPGQVWPLQFADPDDFHRHFGDAQHTPGPPQFWSEDDDGSVLLGPTPDTAYAVRVPYVRSPHVMTLDDDTPGLTAAIPPGTTGIDPGPGLPVRHHMIIVWLALWQYGAYDSAPEVTARAKVNYNTMLSALIADQGEKLVWA